MKRISRTFGAFAVVTVSMLTGVLLTFGYILIAPFSSADGSTIRVRMESFLSRDGEASKASLFDEEQITSIYRTAAPAVVAIFSRVGPREGLGSGVLIDSKGIALTNYHVVRNANQIEVALSDRTRYVGEVLGFDRQNDLAVLRLVDAPSNLPIVPMGDSESLRPGALAVAIGNPHGLERSVSVGVISGLNRTLRDPPGRPPIRDVIQTDAVINQGNSGGPLLNSRGEVVGITTAIEAVSGQRGFGGIGYAVPISTVKRHLERMFAGEEIEHAWLGISGSDVTPATIRERRLTVRNGILVAEAIGGGPAQTAGLQPGDVIITIAGHELRSMDELGVRLDRYHRPGESVPLEVVRGREQLTLDVTLGKWPERLPQR
jgi:serine protease Do